MSLVGMLRPQIKLLAFECIVGDWIFQYVLHFLLRVVSLCILLFCDAQQKLGLQNWLDLFWKFKLFHLYFLWPLFGLLIVFKYFDAFSCARSPKFISSTASTITLFSDDPELILNYIASWILPRAIIQITCSLVGSLQGLLGNSIVDLLLFLL